MLKNFFTKKTKVAFSIENSNLEKLNKKVDSSKISLEKYLEMIVAQYLGWNEGATKAGLIPLPKALLVKIMENITEKQIIGFANYVAKYEIEKIVLQFRQTHNIETFLDVVKSWSKASNFPYEEEKLPDGSYRYLIQHDMGKKWSLLCQSS